jgi:hypothetical protein
LEKALRHVADEQPLAVLGKDAIPLVENENATSNHCSERVKMHDIQSSYSQ